MSAAMKSAPLPDLDLLSQARVHEATGTGRRTFALALASRLQGAVLWIHDTQEGALLYPPGLAAFLDPARLLLARPTGKLALLQTIEEALRAGAVPLVVAELHEAPDLTESRRLQLAAGTGGGRGLCLIPEGKLRTNAAETRWRCDPLPTRSTAAANNTTGQHWEVVKNKKGRLGKWRVTWDPGRERFVEMPEVPEMLVNV